MCPFLFAENYISRELLSVPKRVNGNKFERMDDMSKEIQILSEEKIKEMGRRIKNKRKEKGYKAIDFADIIGVGKDQLSRIENGKLPCKTEYLFIMSQVLDVSVDYLMFGSGNDTVDELAVIAYKIPADLRGKAKKILEALAE